MTIDFIKEEKEIKIYISKDNNKNQFDYINFIKYLYENNKIEDINFTEDFSEDEKEKFSEMITKINEATIKKSEDIKKEN